MNKSQTTTKLHSIDRDALSEDVFKKLNIRYRICTKFVQDKSEERGICVCKRLENVHHERDPRNEGAKWNMFENTDEQLDPQHDKLPNGALFTRLALDTPNVKVERLFYDYWKMSEPRLIISIIGGAKYFTLSERLESNFINGIIDVALKADSWLITNGYNVGIVQLVGQAINKVKLTRLNEHITAIGVCKWGSVKDVERLVEPEHPGKKSKNANNDDERRGDGEKKREKGQRDLETNHSHYLMLDDGRYRHYDIKDYRTLLCAHLAKLQDENALPIPVVTIVVEGGKDTIANIYYDLRENIPVVIIDGSGRVADFFKRCLLYTKDIDETDKYPEAIFEIEEVSLVSPVVTLPIEDPNEKYHQDTNQVKPTHIKLKISKNTLEGRFSRYEERLQKDLHTLLSHEDDSRKRDQTTNSNHTNGNLFGNDFKKVLHQVMYCLQPAVRSGISIFNLSSDNNLSETIFRSICKSQQNYFERKESDQVDAMEKRHRRSKPPLTLETVQRHTTTNRNVHQRDQTAQRSDLLLLAMDWNCIEVAKELILQNSLDKILNKEEAFLYALLHDLPAFIYEFLKLGVDPTEIFFSKNKFSGNSNRYRKLLNCLYDNHQVASNDTHLGSFIESSHEGEKHLRTVDHLNELLTELIGDYMHKLYFETHADEEKYRKSWGLIEDSIEPNKFSVHVASNGNNHSNSTNEPNESEKIDKSKIHDYIMRDLFIWAILMNRTDMAKVFLSHMKYRICAALIATKILKQYHSKAAHGELKEGYKASIDYFQTYAINCINQCEKNDADEACQIVLQRIELYGYVSCLQVAAHAEDKLFIATSCCVQAMNNIWFNKIHPDQSRKRDELGLAIGFVSFGLLAPPLVNFRKTPKIKNDEHTIRTLQPYGLNYSDPYPLEHPRYCKIPGVNIYLHNVKNFYQSLRIKFCCHCVVYCLFLLLFSYVLLFDFQPPTNSRPSIHWTEILTIIFVSIMLIEEIHYFVRQDSLSISGKFKTYVSNVFKIMTLLGFTLFYIGLILRFAYADDQVKFVAARVVMAIDLEIWWLRSLSFIIVVPFLGPHLVAIGKMLKDLLFFMCIIAIVMTGYGVASRSMAYYPNPDSFPGTEIDTSFNGRSIFRQIAYPVYYLMYGEFGNELSNLDANPDAGWSISTHVLLAIHMLFVNILLTNLLIAMFSKRFDQVYEDTKNIWHSQQYIFTREYYTRSPFYPPISFFYDIYYLARIAYYAIRRTCFKNKIGDRRGKVFKMIPVNEDVEKRWYEFEGASTYEYAHAEVKALKTTALISTSGSDSTKTEKKSESNENTNTTTDITIAPNSIRQLQDYLATMSTRLESMNTQLQILVDDKHMGRDNRQKM
ncbi:hypothetical protein I4U23_025751 [Adineta vaga]|nr:hypothetical protein I4U23_025751 [Adineta vaga]